MITVEEATASDIDALIELESALFAQDAGSHDPHADTSWPQREGRRDFEDLLASADALVLVAKRDCQPVGFLVGYVTSSSPTRKPVQYAVLRSLYVNRLSRRLGIASQLTQRCIAWARDRSCVEVHVDHYAANTEAASLYKQLGFRTQSVSRSLPL